MTSIYIGGIIRKMSASAVQLVPVGVRGMKVLEREKFSRNIRVPILKVIDENLPKVIRICKNYFLKLEVFKPVQSIDDDDAGKYKKYIYLNPEMVTQFTDIAEKDRRALSEFNVSAENFDNKEIHLGYENFKAESIFKAVFPGEDITVSGFSQVGHIIHLNLRDHLLEYRFIIGQVLLDKIKHCRTVVCKNNIIDNTFRNFRMEVIAGEEDFFVTVKENTYTFQFDFSKVYWNPRLVSEHERILDFLEPNDVLFDVFCGVGPFSIPAAKRKTQVFANDLNPDSYKWLNHNAQLNKLNLSFFKSYNQDGKDFICSVFKDYLMELCKGSTKLHGKIHITMNLPAKAVEFLKYFNGLLNDESLEENFNYEVLVYVYCFSFAEDSFDDAKKMVNENIGCDVSSDIKDIFYVRKVAPKKKMMRVIFKLTKKVLFRGNDEPPKKKVCV